MCWAVCTAQSRHRDKSGQSVLNFSSWCLVLTIDLATGLGGWKCYPHHPPTVLRWSHCILTTYESYDDRMCFPSPSMIRVLVWLVWFQEFSSGVDLGWAAAKRLRFGIRLVCGPLWNTGGFLWNIWFPHVSTVRRQLCFKLVLLAMQAFRFSLPPTFATLANELSKIQQNTCHP